MVLVSATPLTPLPQTFWRFIIVIFMRTIIGCGYILHLSSIPKDVKCSSKLFCKMSITQSLVLQTLETITDLMLSYRLFSAFCLDQFCRQVASTKTLGCKQSEETQNNGLNSKKDKQPIGTQNKSVVKTTEEQDVYQSAIAPSKPA